MSIKYEYYYLFGLDIPLDNYKLGKIKQPKAIDFIKHNIDIENFYFPFIMTDILLNSLDNQEDIIKIKRDIGSLSFLILSCNESKRFDVLDKLKESINLLYGCNVDITQDSIFLDNGVIINNSNFDILCNIVLEMMMVEKPKIEKQKVYKNKHLQATWDKLQKYRKKEAQKSETAILDIMNLLIHMNGNYDYEKVLNMTVYQILNSYIALLKKDNYSEFLSYKTSGQFKLEKEKKHWITEIKVKKSTYSKLG